jgi:hypothetical protein
VREGRFKAADSRLQIQVSGLCNPDAPVGPNGARPGIPITLSAARQAPAPLEMPQGRTAGPALHQRANAVRPCHPPETRRREPVAVRTSK